MSDKLLEMLISEVKEISSNMATKEDLQEIHNRMDRTETKIDGIVNQVVSNSEKLSQLDNLNEVQKQQAKILDTLSVRSIKQESELRDLQKETEPLRK